MLFSNFDLYALVNQISDVLLQQGYGEWSNRLLNAMSISTLPGEILGELKLCINALLKEEFVAGLGIKSDLENATSYLNKVLG